MALTLCSTCRLPVPDSVLRCPHCAAVRSVPHAALHVPVAAAAALLAALAVLVWRRA